MNTYTVAYKQAVKDAAKMIALMGAVIVMCVVVDWMI